MRSSWAFSTRTSALRCIRNFWPYPTALILSSLPGPRHGEGKRYEKTTKKGLEKAENSPRVNRCRSRGSGAAEACGLERCRRQQNKGAHAFSRVTVDPGRAAVKLGKAADERKSQPGAACLAAIAVVDLVEGHEDLIQKRRRDAGAVVADAEFTIPVIPLQQRNPDIA